MTYLQEFSRSSLAYYIDSVYPSEDLVSWLQHTEAKHPLTICQIQHGPRQSPQARRRRRPQRRRPPTRQADQREGTTRHPTSRQQRRNRSRRQHKVLLQRRPSRHVFRRSHFEVLPSFRRATMDGYVSNQCYGSVFHEHGVSAVAREGR